MKRFTSYVLGLCGMIILAAGQDSCLLQAQTALKREVSGEEDNDEDIDHDLGESEESTSDTKEKDGEKENHDEEEDDEQEKLPADIRHDVGLGPHPDLVLSLPLVLMNLTNLSAWMNSMHDFRSRNATYDREVLFEKVEGFFGVMHDHLAPDHAQQHCPKRDVSVIQKCVDIAICLVQGDVGQTNFSLAQYSLYEELLSRFEAITWDLLILELEEDTGDEVPDSFGIPEKYSCNVKYEWLYKKIRREAAKSEEAQCANLEGSYTSSSVQGIVVVEQLGCSGSMRVDGDTRTYTIQGTQVTIRGRTFDDDLTAHVRGDHGNYKITVSTGDVLEQLQLTDDHDTDDDEDGQAGLDLAQVTAERMEKLQTLAAALQTSAVLDSAVQGTHHILDSHRANSSMAATIRQLELAWEPFCTRVRCDHTNYHDMFGATHTHSLALIEAGASAQHMRSHIRSRLAMENRMMRFLGEYGEHGAGQVYRAEGDLQGRAQQYLSPGKVDMMKFLESYSSRKENVLKLIGWVDRHKLRAHLVHTGAVEDYPASHEDSLIQTGASGRVGWGRRRRRSPRRRRSCGWFSWACNIGKAVVGAVKSVAKAVTNVVHFVGQLFACAGTASTLVATGYCKKFPAPPAGDNPTGLPWTGVGVSMRAGLTDINTFRDAMKGRPLTAGFTLGISAVFGAVPFSPVTGGVRSGVGMGVSFGCAIGKGCKVGLSVGAVVSALIPATNKDCYFGSYFVTFKCMLAAGLTVSIMCCQYEIISGTHNCR